ncbi:MAG TPA: response regulator transcription factor [Candidatus Deferrimicrobium sp.]|nr:response regulator transcription factor [Candidatus Deferrimicrobium sp.]
MAAEAGALRRLRSIADDLELAGVRPAEAGERALELRPAVFAWLGPDATEGLAVMRMLRGARSSARTLYLTPRSAESERLAALAAGVDEVLSEPISRSELVGRLRLLLRRARPVGRSRLTIASNLELDLDRRELWRDGDWVHLRPKEARLLELFARAPGRVLSREHILERVWGPDHEGDPRTVDVHVRWLRSKIEPDPHEPVRLLTVRGVGYRLESAPLTKR